MQRLSDDAGRPSRLRPAWEEDLNEAQRAAVEHTEGPLLVIAGAGSGKTRTLTHRVARLVSAGVPPAAILLLTFTRRASQEMLQRASRLLDDRCERVSGGTFHSFANLKLRQYASYTGLSPDCAILDRSDAEDLICCTRRRRRASGSHGSSSFPPSAPPRGSWRWACRTGCRPCTGARQPGRTGMVGETGVVKRALAPEGQGLVEGELWRAVTETGAIGEGERVRVTGVKDLTLTVVRATDTR